MPPGGLQGEAESNQSEALLLRGAASQRPFFSGGLAWCPPDGKRLGLRAVHSLALYTPLEAEQTLRFSSRREHQCDDHTE